MGEQWLRASYLSWTTRQAASLIFPMWQATSSCSTSGMTGPAPSLLPIPGRAAGDFPTAQRLLFSMMGPICSTAICKKQAVTEPVLKLPATINCGTLNPKTPSCARKCRCQAGSIRWRRQYRTTTASGWGASTAPKSISPKSCLTARATWI